MTTGLTTGPFALELGSTLATPDPNANSSGGSVNAQFQNASAYAITVQGGTDQWTVTSYQATTIPCPPGGLGFLVTPESITGTPGNGQLTVVWLLNNQEAPQPDGPLTSPTGTLVAGLGIKQGELAAGNNVSWDLTVPLFMSDFVIIGAIAGAPTSSSTLTATGDTTSTVYLTAHYGVLYQPVNESLVISGATETGVTVELSNTGLGTFIYSLAFTALGTGGTQVLTFPGIPLDVVPYGGASSVNGTIASTSVTQILAAPASGAAYRLHSLCATTTTQSLDLLTTGQPIAVVTAPGFIYLGGIITASTVSIKASGATTMAYNLAYDTVTLPSIS